MTDELLFSQEFTGRGGHKIRVSSAPGMFLTDEDKRRVVLEVAEAIASMDPDDVLIHTDAISVQRVLSDEAYVLMFSRGDEWWHPVATFSDKLQAEQTMKAMKARLGRLLGEGGDYLSLMQVPLDRVMADEGKGHLWKCHFTWDDEGNWWWDHDIMDIGDTDPPEEPPDIYSLVEYGTINAVVDMEYVPVLARTLEEAAEQASPIVRDWVQAKTGKDARHQGFA